MRFLLVLAFIVVPIIELWVIVAVGAQIGTGPTILLLVIDSVIGAWLVKREGLKAWHRFREALVETRLPAEEVMDAALVLFGGALMLTPGFVTDLLGLLLVIPPSRALVNKALRGRVRMFFGGVVSGGVRGVGGARRQSPSAEDPEVVDVEVVSIERTLPPSTDDSA